MTQIEQSQKEFMAWAENAEAFRTPQCIHGFGDSDCAYPACKCLAMPISFAGSEPVEEMKVVNDLMQPTEMELWVYIVLWLIAVVVFYVSFPSVMDWVLK